MKMEDCMESMIKKEKVQEKGGGASTAGGGEGNPVVPTHVFKVPAPPKSKNRKEGPPVPKKPEKRTTTPSSSTESLNSVPLIGKSDEGSNDQRQIISASTSPSSSRSSSSIKDPKSGHNLPENVPLTQPEKSSPPEMGHSGMETVSEAKSGKPLCGSEITDKLAKTDGSASDGIEPVRHRDPDCGQSQSQKVLGLDGNLVKSESAGVPVPPPPPDKPDVLPDIKEDRNNLANFVELDLDGGGAIEAINQSSSRSKSTSESKSVPNAGTGNVDLNQKNPSQSNGPNQHPHPHQPSGSGGGGGNPSAISLCPFLPFHNQNANLSEFLSLGHKVSGTGLTPGPTPTFPSNKKVDDTIQFIVENVKDGGGIWPSVFLEKLIRMLVTTKDDGVSKCFCEKDFSLLIKLVDAFTQEKRCSLVYRYYCLFYNIMSRGVVPLGEIVKTGLLARLQEDFELAAANRCRCRNNACDDGVDDPTATLNLLPDSEAREHLEFNPNVLLGLSSFLLIPIYTELADLELTHQLDLEREKVFSTTIIRLICDFESDHIFPDQSGDQAQAQGDFGCDSKKVNLINTKAILTHLLISQNLCQGRNKESNAVLESISSLQQHWDHSQLKDKLMTIFIQELFAFEQGYKEGIQAALNVHLQAPLGLQLKGLMGPIKLFNDILTLRCSSGGGGGNATAGGSGGSVNFDGDREPGREGFVGESSFFNVDDLSHLATTAMAVLEIIGMRKDTRDKTDEEIQLHTRKLLTVLQQRIHHTLTQAKIIYVGPSFVEVGLDWADSKADINMTLANSRFTMNTSEGSGHSMEVVEEGKRSILSKSKVMLWPLERMLKWFGCSKRMASSSVGPASVRDVEYLRFSSGNNVTGTGNGWSEGSCGSGSGSGPSCGGGGGGSSEAG